MELCIRLLSMQLLILLAANHVEPFTITGKFNGDNDASLARAISVLKRQEKRSVEHYRSPDTLLNGGAVTVEDVQNWLKTPKMEDENFENLNQDTISNSGLRFKDIDSLLRHNVYPEKRTSLTLSSVLPRRHEIEDTFDSRDFNDGSSIPNLISESLAESKFNNQVKSFSDNKQNNGEMEAAIDVHGGVAVNTLTKEEFSALMKAIDKLQKQSERFEEKAPKILNSEATFKEIVDNNQGPESMKIVQAVKDQEMKLTHDRVVSPVTMETSVISQNTPETRVLKKQKKGAILPQNSEADEIENEDFVNELTLALQENVVAAVEKAIREEIQIQKENRKRPRIREGSVVAWGIKNHGRNTQTVKRNNNKRSGSVLPAFINDLFDDDDDDAMIPLGLEKFVARIVKLEQEVDRLRLVSQLESLENDVLTDALNEASLGQSEETVTDLEFESLKEAISIEEAIQDLRKSRNSNSRSPAVGVVKRGQLWRRKRGSTLGRDLAGTRHLPSQVERDPSFKGQRATKEDIRRLLGQTYLMKDQETRQSGPQQASFLRPNLGRRNLR